MATQTTNYGLKKPSYSDTADIGVINSNMDVIDAKMKEIDDKAGSGGGGTSVAVDSELSTTSENPVQNKVITQELSKKGTYSKPTGGIPKTDLANEVQTSLGKADTALQEHQDISGKAEKTEVTALFNSISDEWNPLITYAVGQYCIHNNILWKCLVANTNTEPTEGTHWTKVSVANEITSLNSSLSSLSDMKYMILDNKARLVYNDFIAMIQLSSQPITSKQEGWAIVATLPEGIRPKDAYFAVAYTNDANTFNVSYALPLRLTVDGIISVYLYADKLSARPTGQLVFFVDK